MNKKETVLDVLRNIQDPDLNRDIVSLGFVKLLTIDEKNQVSFTLELTTPACPVKEHFKNTAEAYVRQLDWVKGVSVTMTAAHPKSTQQQTSDPLKGVKNIIAVSSCKGGVGKSTVAVNLAYSLAQRGGKVGIFDADIYGPSLPTMIGIENPALEMDGQFILPFEKDNLKLMSFGYVQEATQNTGAAIMRGPMVTKVLSQLLLETKWEELDYLIVDFPPGTGDIQIALGQLVKLTAAVIVTTPQIISFVDVAKGIEMFDKLKVPTISVVENMSYFECGKCSEKHRIFGEGAKKRLVNDYGIAHTFEIPMDDVVSATGDSGTPLMVSSSDSPAKAIFDDLSEAVVREVSKINMGANKLPLVGYDEKKGIELIPPNGKESIFIHPRMLRINCKCARCKDELSGKPFVKIEDIPEDVHPLSMSPVGNYALGINWSDGHSSLMPYDLLYQFA
jgi:Mrp family chromosome partitioning ATPase/DUF971 family protein